MKVHCHINGIPRQLDPADENDGIMSDQQGIMSDQLPDQKVKNSYCSESIFRPTEHTLFPPNDSGSLEGGGNESKSIPPTMTPGKILAIPHLSITIPDEESTTSLTFEEIWSNFSERMGPDLQIDPSKLEEDIKNFRALPTLNESDPIKITGSFASVKTIDFDKQREVEINGRRLKCPKRYPEKVVIKEINIMRVCEGSSDSPEQAAFKLENEVAAWRLLSQESGGDPLKFVGFYTESSPPDKLCLVMERAKGNSLASLEGSLPAEPEERERKAKVIARGWTEALSRLHNSGIAHLDIKPDNAFYEFKKVKDLNTGEETEVCTIQLVDFGESIVAKDEKMWKTLNEDPTASSELSRDDEYVLRLFGERPHDYATPFGPQVEKSNQEAYSMEQADMYALANSLLCLLSSERYSAPFTGLPPDTNDIKKFLEKEDFKNMSVDFKAFIVDSMNKSTPVKALQHPWLTSQTLAPIPKLSSDRQTRYRDSSPEDIEELTRSNKRSRH